MGVLIGVIMQGYTKADRAGAAALDDPGDAGRHRRPAGAVLVPVHDRRRGLGRRSRSTSSSQILAILLISQFWTLANDVYDPRQAKRIFGFIGGGASLGGATGAGLTAFLVAVGRLATT